MRQLLLAAGAAAALLAGCSSMGGEAGDTLAGLTMPADPTPEQRVPYVAMAASSDMYEIQSGQLAQQRAQNPSLRTFGGMLVQHHTQTTQQLTAAARASNTPVPMQMMPLHAMMLERLRAQTGANFDRAFVAQQIMAHEMALNLHRNYSQAGDTPALRATAAAATPIIQSHLDQARQLPR